MTVGHAILTRLQMKVVGSKKIKSRPRQITKENTKMYFLWDWLIEPKGPIKGFFDCLKGMC
jgi:hypothetical protein